MNDVINHRLPIYGQSQVSALADIDRELAEFEQQ
jgi:hypothetical protein